MGGGGYSTFDIGPFSPSIERKIAAAQEKEQLEFISNVNDYLSTILALFNGRDREATNRKLDRLQELLGNEFEVDKILFSGSVAKHTDIDGISDVDSLVILDRQELKEKKPGEVLDAFYSILDSKLPRSEIADIKKGKLAVTVKFSDNIEIQLLPALKTKNTVAISSYDGTNWNETKPKEFQKLLSSANIKMNNALVPAIKLMKAVNDNLPLQKQLKGYHIEGIAVDSIKNYDGEKTPRALLLHIIAHASERILVPIKDKTGQSHMIDSYLGKADSIERKNISQTLSGLKRRLETATTIQQWKSVFGVDNE